MDYTKLDLRKTTFLDFTQDAKIIEEVVGDAGDLAYFRSLFDASEKDETTRGFAETRRALSFVDYAEIIEDAKLLALAQKEFEKELSSFFSE